MPTTVLGHKSPFELLFGKPPQLNHLRVFGCLCYMATTKQGRDKFQDKAVACVFMGYPHCKKGYKVMSLTDNKVYISRDVIFHESVYPFANQASHTNNSFFCISQTTTFHDFCDFSPHDITNTRPDSSFSTPSTTPAECSSTHHSDRPVRAHKLPTYLQDYVLSSPITDCPHHCLTTTTDLCLQPPSISSFCLSSSS